MKRLLSAIGCAASLWCLSTGSIAGQDAPERVLERFAANFSTLDVSAMTALFRPDTAFFGSTVPRLLRGPAGVDEYFQKAWAGAAPGTMTCDIQSIQKPTQDVTLMAAMCQLARPGRTSVVRVSAALTHDVEGWLFSDLHVSAEPPTR